MKNFGKYIFETLAIFIGIGVFPSGGACGFDAKGLPGIAIFFGENQKIVLFSG